MKKSLAIILSLVMLLSLIPVTSFAGSATLGYYLVRLSADKFETALGLCANIEEEDAAKDAVMPLLDELNFSVHNGNRIIYLVDGDSADCLFADSKLYNDLCPESDNTETIKESVEQGNFWYVLAAKTCAHENTVSYCAGTEATCAADGYKGYYKCSVCGVCFEDAAAATAIDDIDAWKTGAGKVDTVRTIVKLTGDEPFGDVTAAYIPHNNTSDDVLSIDYATREYFLNHYREIWGPYHVAGKEVCFVVGVTVLMIPYFGDDHIPQMRSVDAYRLISIAPGADSFSTSDLVYSPEDIKSSAGTKVVFYESDVRPQHSPELQEGTPAGCANAGYKDYYKCSVCYALFEDGACRTPIDDIDEWIAGDGKTAAAHVSPEHREEVPATCTENGYTAGVYCTACETWISGHELIPAGHKDENGDYYCDVCSEPIGAKVDAAPVEELIGLIPDNVTKNDEAVITAAREAYEALSNDAKALVTNLDKLEAAEEAFAKLSADNELTAVSGSAGTAAMIIALIITFITVLFVFLKAAGVLTV